MEFISDTAGIITMKIKPDFKVLGKIYGKRMKEIAAAFAAFDQKTIAEIRNAEAAGQDYTFALPSGDVVLRPGDYEISSEDMPGWIVASEGPLTVALDIEISDDLRKEGVARELINRIQNLRKDSGFEVVDRVNVEVFAAGSDFFDIAAAVDDYYEYITSQTLSEIDSVSDLNEAPADAAEVEWNESSIKIKVSRI